MTLFWMGLVLNAGRTSIKRRKNVDAVGVVGGCVGFCGGVLIRPGVPRPHARPADSTRYNRAQRYHSLSKAAGQLIRIVRMKREINCDCRYIISTRRHRCRTTTSAASRL